MPEEYPPQASFQPSNLGTRDLEEKQRVLKDRLILIGQNLIEIKENTEEEILNLKKEVESLKEILARTKSLVETMSGEFSKLAKKDDLEILKKQAKLFQPLEFVRKEDLHKK